MNLSSRWCVTAFIALGTLSCSDPVAPPAQGAFKMTLSGVMPPNGKGCPSGPSFTFDVPDVLTTKPLEVLDTDTYLHWVVNNESDASVSCKVSGSSTFTFEGRIALGVKVLDISGGTLDDQKKGTATITVSNGTKLSDALSSPGATCTVDANPATGRYQAAAGHMWAAFSCPSLEHQPSDACAANGVFVLENCSQ